MNYTTKINEFIESGLITPSKHPAMYEFLFQESLKSAPWTEWMSQSPYFNIYNEYITEIEKWILSTNLNKITGLEKFVYKDVIIGTTQTFDEAYFTHSGKQLRIFKNEYGYHSRNYKNIKFLDIDDVYTPLEKNDWVIVSLPFSGNGNVHQFYDIMIADAESKQIPVIIDCAWFGTCKNIDINLNHSCIESVSFSLSKGIGMGYMRTGIRYSNLLTGPIRQQNDYKHLVFSNMQLGLHQIKNFNPDYVQKKYSTSYKTMCDDLDLTETNCIHVAMYKNKLLGVRNLVKTYYKKERIT